MAVIPDKANFGLENENIPDNFIHDALDKAKYEHKRDESRMESLRNDFGNYLEDNVASNIAQNLLVHLMDDDDDDHNINNNNHKNNHKNNHNKNNNNELPKTSTLLTPKNTIVMQPMHTNMKDIDLEQENETNDEQQQNHAIDQMLIDTVYAHKNKESRTDFLDAKLHELFDSPLIDKEKHNNNNNNNDKEQETPGNDNIPMDMSKIAQNLIGFIQGDDNNDNNKKPEKKNNNKTRGSSDLLIMQNKINSLTETISNLTKELDHKNKENQLLNKKTHELETQNIKLLRDIQFLQNCKTELALNSNIAINELRDCLLEYQKIANKKNKKK